MEILTYILDNYCQKPIFLDPVSTTKAMKVKDRIALFHTIKPNLKEAQGLTGISGTSLRDVSKMGEAFIKAGVKGIFISMGFNGVYINNGSISKVLTFNT
jgi:pseudouridine kinase